MCWFIKIYFSISSRSSLHERTESYAQKMFIIEFIITYDVNLKQFLQFQQKKAYKQLT